MSEELAKLKSLGAQKIYEDTHIPVLHVKGILEHNFAKLQRVQFLGFVSILEREYRLNLSSLKVSGIAFFDEKDATSLEEGLFVVPKEQKKTNAIYSLIAIAIVIVVVGYEFGYFGEEKSKEQQVDNALIHKVQKTIKPVKIVEELNATKVNSTTKTKLEVIEVSEVVVQVAKSFKIFTKSKVWFGYIDVETNQKKQRTFRGEIDLDPNKKWLLIFGHGYIDMFVNGEVVKMKSRENIRFLYEDSSVKKISLREFKRLNRGRKW
ncbi:membrane protein [hydrothermal vent metagenome]|uniref:Membrane protein n=1 Tax=hydrothermal vent metagenome TaxID=652676 RepID=A0A1W1BCR8_9ZZZZ